LKKEAETMQDREVPATVERKMALMAALTLLTGTAVLGFADWKALGWVIVAYGLTMLVVAYLLAVAPHREDL
jgi:1,4-dihydroxy-2-naphthoate octaprenyltransferase